MVRILDLGPLSVQAAGVTRPLSGRRLEALLIAMLVRPGRIVTADYLIDAVWGEQTPARAAAALDTLMWRLRRHLEPNRGPGTLSTVITHTDGQGYRLVATDTDIDSWAFAAFAEQLSRGAVPPDQRLAATAAALQLWRGLPYEHAPDNAGIEAARAQLVEQRLTVQIGRIDALLDAGQPERAVTEVIPMLAVEPYAEPLWARRITGLRRAGRFAAADAVYAECARLFDADLGTRPGPEIRAAHESDIHPSPPIRAGRAHIDGEFRVPVHRTALIGRRVEIEAVVARCRRGPLTCLTGPVGSGKTRLAIAVAQELRGEFPDGIYFADLSGVTDGSLTADRVQHALQLPDDPARHASRVVYEFLADRAALLILDNCEQIGDAVASLAESVLQLCPQVRILATSRQPLGLDDESVYPVRPLALPTGTAAADLTASDAAALLGERLGDRTGFTSFTDAERAAIARICAATDGLPLSLELAAALAPVLQLHEIADHLAADPMGLARIGRTTRRPRAESGLRDSIEWSYALLTPVERIVHRRLALLPPEFSLEAAVAVCSDADVAAGEVPHALAGLAYRSLLDAVGPHRPGGPSRFHQLVPMRAHAVEQLNASGEAAAVAARFRRWARELLLSGPRPGRPGQAEFYQRIGDSHRAITEAMAVALVEGPSDDDVFAVARLLPYWIDRMIPSDSLRLSAALCRAVTPANGPLARAAAVLVRGAVLAANQQAARARDDLQQAITDVARVPTNGIDAQRWVRFADLLVVVATCCWIGDDVDLAVSVVDVVARHANRLGDADLRICVAMFGCLAQLLTDPRSAAVTATALTVESQAVGNDLAQLMGSVTCSIAALLDGDAAAGLHWSSAALRLQRTLGVRGIADTLETRGNHYMVAERPVEAVRCYAAAHAQQRRLGRPWPHHPGTEARVVAARKHLTHNQFADAWAEGERVGAADLVDDWL